MKPSPRDHAPATPRPRSKPRRLRTRRVRDPRASLDELLAVLSHELRTPLTAILGWVHMLRSQEMAPERRDHALAVIERNARAQARMIADLLDVSRISSGVITLQRVPVAMPALVRAAFDGIRDAAVARSIALEFDVPASVPSVSGDVDRLRQVVASLLSNAVKFTPEGGRVRATLKAEGATVVLRIEDNGRGIRPDFLAHVFEPFRQSDPALTRSHGGLGVGLAIARHIVEAHGGVIAAASDGAGCGASFEVRLPARARVTRARTGKAAAATRRAR